MSHHEKDGADSRVVMKNVNEKGGYRLCTGSGYIKKDENMIGGLRENELQTML